MKAFILVLLVGVALAEVRDKVECDATHDGDVYSYSAKLMNGSTEVKFSDLKGQVTLFVPSANYDARSRAEALAVAELAKAFPKVWFLMFSTTQFNYEEVFTKPSEFFNVLEHVRPGDGFMPPKNMVYYLTMDINGAKGQPVFAQYLTKACEWTRDEFRTDITYLDIYTHDVRNPFEAFLVGKDGKAIFHYDITSDKDISDDITAALAA